MESTASLCAPARFTLGKTLNTNCSPLIYNLHRRFYKARASQLALVRLSRILCASGRGVNAFGSVPLSGTLGGVALRPVQRRLECVSSSAASFASGGGAFGGNDGSSGGGGGGDGASDGGEAKPDVVAGGADDVSALSSDVIILDVGGMTCGGCAASVKRILESQPQVSSASVNLTTETAIVWPVSEAKVMPNWKKQLGEVRELLKGMFNPKNAKGILVMCNHSILLHGESELQKMVDSLKEGHSCRKEAHAFGII